MLGLRFSCFVCLVVCLVACIAASTLTVNEEFSFPRCQVVPQPNREASFQIDGAEITRWHFGTQYPRPFFFPFRGPSGASLVRMGHPGAPNHDHHRGIWIGHHSINGTDFWSDNSGASIRQKMWNCYVDGEQAVMVSTCGWFDSENVELAEQQIVSAMLPYENGEHALEIQITIRPPDGKTSLAIDKTNFGFLAIRVAKSISSIFGGGIISSSEGAQGERSVFGKRARWVDYSGPVAVGKPKNRHTTIEGITCFDHPSNPRYPTFWHVRDDGWMGASFGMQKGFTVVDKAPLILRYLVYAHHGSYDHEKSEETHAKFGRSNGFRVFRSSKPHHQFDVERTEE